MYDQLVSEVFQQTLTGKMRRTTTNVDWRQVVEKKAYRGRMWKNDGERTISAWNVGTFLLRKIKDKEVSTVG